MGSPAARVALSGVVVVGLWIGMLAIAGPAAAEKRVALVIGNSAYEHVAPLANPANDAADMAAALGRLGFDVVVGRDLTYRDMRKTIRDFAEKLEGADVGLLFYAGHGLQVSGSNYLAPIDARLDSETDLDFSMIGLDLVLRQMERQAKTNLVFLDACRDNPLAKNLARSMGTRSAAVGRGLARVTSGVGTLIAFATEPGNVALDGDGRNSPFTTALLDNIEEPGVNLGDVMISVRQSVLTQTGGKQVPWEHSSLTERFFFARKQEVAAVQPAPQPQPQPVESSLSRGAGNQALELAFWNAIKDSDNLKSYEAYLEQYPSGTFAPLARVRIDELKTPEPARPAAKAPERRPEPKPAPKPVEVARAAPPVDVELYAGNVDDRMDIYVDGARQGSCTWQTNPGCSVSLKRSLSGVREIRFKLTNYVYTGFCIGSCGKWAADMHVKAGGRTLWKSQVSERNNTEGVKVDVRLKCDFTEGRCTRVR